MQLILLLADTSVWGDNTLDQFSFVLLKNIGLEPLSTSDNSWFNTNVFRIGESDITHTSNAGISGRQQK